MAITYKFKADSSGYTNTLKKMRAQTQSFSADTSKLMKKAFAFTGLAGFAQMTRQLVSFGSEMSDLATRTRTTVKEFMVFRDVARDAGVEQSVLERALRNVVQRTQAAVDGNKSYAKSIQRLGLDINEFNNLSTAEKFIAVANASKNATNQTEAFRDIAVLLGERAGPQLLEVLNKIATEGFDNLADKAVTMTDKQAQELDRLEDHFQKFKESSILSLLRLFEFFKAGISGVAAAGTQAVIEISQGFINLGKIIKSVFSGDLSDAERRFDAFWDEGGIGSAGKRVAQAFAEAADEVLGDGIEVEMKPKLGDNLGIISEEDQAKIEELRKKGLELERKAGDLSLSNAEKLIKLKQDHAEIEDFILSTVENAGNAVQLEEARLKIKQNLLDQEKLIIAANKDQDAIIKETLATYQAIAEIKNEDTASGEAEKSLADAIEKRILLEKQYAEFQEKSSQERKNRIDKELSIVEKLNKAKENVKTVESKIEAGGSVSTDEFAEYAKSLNSIEELEQQLAWRREKTTEETKKAAAEQASYLSAIIATQTQENKLEKQTRAPKDAVEAMQRASQKLFDLKAELAELEKNAAADGIFSDEERLEIAKKRKEIVEGIATAEERSKEARDKLKEIEQSQREAKLTPEEKQFEKEEGLKAERQKLERLENAALKDGKIGKAEQAAIDEQRLNVAEAEKEAADAREIVDDSIRNTQERIEQERDVRSEIGLTDEELLAKARREQSTLQDELSKISPEDTIERGEKELEIEQKKTEVAGLEQQIAGADDEAGPSIIASSLAAIGGGGGVAAFGGDPILSENQKQTSVLEAIRKELQAANSLETTGDPNLPEL